MNPVHRFFPILIIMLIGGCSALPSGKEAPKRTGSRNMMARTLARVGDSLGRGNRQNDTEKNMASGKPETWDWSLAIPGSATRAELISTTLPNSSVMQLVPEIQESEIALVSYTEQSADSSVLDGQATIVKVGDQPIKNWGQLHDAVESALESGELVPVEFRDGQGTRSADILPATLNSLAQTAAGDEAMIRVSDGGNSSLLIREDGIQCKLTARVEREFGLLHLVVTLGNSDGKQLLPVEVRANCSGQPLRCLSAADALELLYGDADEFASRPLNQADSSFAATSEREDFLIPSNYERLEKQNRHDQNQTGNRRQPALAAMPGVLYPGPAVLGDARALSSFLLQQEFYEPGQPERVGWILFEGNSLRKNQEVDVDLDLGNGMRKIRFMLPAR